MKNWTIVDEDEDDKEDQDDDHDDEKNQSEWNRHRWYLGPMGCLKRFKTYFFRTQLICD